VRGFLAEFPPSKSAWLRYGVAVTATHKIRYAGTMDANLITAIVTSVATAGSSTTISIGAILQTNKRIDDIAGRLDPMDRRLEAIEQHLGVFVVDIARLKERTGLA
jgi:hypothetical protein